MRHAGQVVTRTMLLESVWDYHFDPQTNVIDVHVSRLRQKIDKPLPDAADPYRAQRRLHDPGACAESVAADGRAWAVPSGAAGLSRRRGRPALDPPRLLRAPASASRCCIAALFARQRGRAGAVAVVVDRRPARPADRRRRSAPMPSPVGALRRRRAAGLVLERSRNGWRQNVEDDAIYLLIDPARPADRRQPRALAARGGAERRLVRTADRARRHALAARSAAARPARRLPAADRSRRPGARAAARGC